MSHDKVSESKRGVLCKILILTFVNKALMKILIYYM
jgi:hypothetical protein